MARAPRNPRVARREENPEELLAEQPPLVVTTRKVEEAEEPPPEDDRKPAAKPASRLADVNMDLDLGSLGEILPPSPTEDDSKTGDDASSNTSDYDTDEELDLELKTHLPLQRQVRWMCRNTKRLQRRLNTALAAAAAANRAAVAAYAAVQKKPPSEYFSLSPGLCQQGILNFEDTNNKKLFASATMSVFPPEGYDCSALRLSVFLKEVHRRAMQYGWDHEILMIPTNPVEPNKELRSLITHHGEVTLQQVRFIE